MSGTKGKLALSFVAVAACLCVYNPSLLSKLSPQFPLQIIPPTDSLDAQGRRLQHSPVNSWTTGESFETSLGVVPTISCPVGKYREFGTGNINRPVGQRHDGCEPCPRGRYGSTTDLTSNLCTDDCPKGRYRDITGGTSEDDCFFCPEGTYGSDEGLTTRDCSGMCTDQNTATTGYYSDVAGISRIQECKTCPVGYRGWQCNWDLIPRLGTFTSTDGRINENAHQYLMKGDDGTWSAEKKDTDYAGAWPTAGAYPENAPIYPGKMTSPELSTGWDNMNEGYPFDPAATERGGIAPVP